MNKTARIVSSIAASLIIASSFAMAQTTAPKVTASKNCAPVLKAKVNINKAALEDMKCLPGFVTSIAQDVIDNRPFKDGKDFMIKIEIIGKKLWPKIEPYVVFK